MGGAHSQVLSDVAETENLGESMFTRLVTQGVRPEAERSQCLVQGNPNSSTAGE